MLGWAALLLKFVRLYIFQVWVEEGIYVASRCGSSFRPIALCLPERPDCELLYNQCLMSDIPS